MTNDQRFDRLEDKVDKILTILSKDASSPFQTLKEKENERRYILEVLTYTNWRIKGTGGAAKLLEIPPSTLYTKMKKLGIKRAVTTLTSEDRGLHGD